MTDWTDAPLDQEQAQRLYALQQVAAIPATTGFGSKTGRSTGDLVYLAEWVIGGVDATDDPMERDDPVITYGEGEESAMVDIDGESYVRTALARDVLKNVLVGDETAIAVATEFIDGGGL